MMTYQSNDDGVEITIVDGETIVNYRMDWEEVWWMTNDFVTFLESKNADVSA